MKNKDIIVFRIVRTGVGELWKRKYLLQFLINKTTNNLFNIPFF